MEFSTVIVLVAILLSVLTTLVIQFGLKITTIDGRKKMVRDAQDQFNKGRTDLYKINFMTADFSRPANEFIYGYCKYDEPILLALMEAERARAKFKHMHDIVYPTKSTKSKE